MSIRTGCFVAISLLLSGMASSQQAGTQSGALGSSWADAAKMPDLFSGQWQTRAAMVEARATLNVPYTAKVQKYVDSYKHVRDIAYAQEGCRTPGIPITMRSGPLAFMYRPGLISIYMQGIGHTRFIRMNEPMGKTSPKYYGNSVGHWEGDTLVVETQDFLPEISFQYGVGKGIPGDEAGPRGRGRGGPPEAPGTGAESTMTEITTSIPKAIWGPHGEGMRMVERMRLINPTTMELNLTIYDDTVWTQPYVAQTRHYNRYQKGVNPGRNFSGDPEEWVCTLSITSFDPETNSYKDMDPAEVVKFLDNLGR